MANVVTQWFTGSQGNNFPEYDYAQLAATYYTTLAVGASFFTPGSSPTSLSGTIVIYFTPTGQPQGP